VLGGLWSTYWYNGETYGSEIFRGFDVFSLKPTAQLSQNEIDAAREVQVERLNVQHQDEITWEPSFAVVRSFADQLVRAGTVNARIRKQINKFVDRAEGFSESGQTEAARQQLHELAGQLEGAQFDALRGAVLDLANSLP
jgi:hypothetical protein